MDITVTFTIVVMGLLATVKADDTDSTIMRTLTQLDRVYKETCKSDVPCFLKELRAQGIRSGYLSKYRQSKDSLYYSTACVAVSENVANFLKDICAILLDRRYAFIDFYQHQLENHEFMDRKLALTLEDVTKVINETDVLPDRDSKLKRITASKNLLATIKIYDHVLARNCKDIVTDHRHPFYDACQVLTPDEEGKKLLVHW